MWMILKPAIPWAPLKKNHKLCGVYWVLGNLPPGSHSSFSSIYLTILCKTYNIKIYDYDKILERILQDLKTLEDHGIYVHLLGKSLRGTVHSVVADNMGAHNIAGLTESFSGDYFCRFCTAKCPDIRSDCVASGAFSLRSKEGYGAHVKEALQNDTHLIGIKRVCVLTKNLSHFHFVSGFPPDVAHDVLEGIVPVELAYCLTSMILKILFILASLNKAILAFPYKCSDITKTNHMLCHRISWVGKLSEAMPMKTGVY